MGSQLQMSLQGPLIVVSTSPRPLFATALDDAQMFPVIDATWADASRAIAQVQPAAVLVAMAAVAEPGFEALAKQIAARKPYLPLIAVDPQTSLPENAIPFSQTGGHFERLAARVLAEDTRFRNLPVVVTLDGLTPAYDLPNLEIITGDPARVAANALPLIRQHAFEAHLSRTLRSIDAGGLLDPRTGLLMPAAFNRDFATAVHQTLSRGGGLSVARFAFDPAQARAQLDGARILSRLMRQMDFGTVREDGSVIVVFAETDLRTAHMIARRLSSVMRHTTHGKRDTRSEPVVTLATMQPGDSAISLLARLHDEARRVAS